MIGCSSGWAFMSSDKEGIVKKHRLIGKIYDGIELNLGSNRLEFYLSESRESLNLDHSYVSFHLPTISTKTEKENIQELVKKFEPDNLILHPQKDSLDEIEIYLKNKNIADSLALENMDAEKKDYKNLCQLYSLLEKFDLNACIDLQHLFEMYQRTVPKEILDGVIQQRVSQIHISGESPVNRHSLVHLSDNSQWITSFYNNYLSGRPVIVEGKYETEKQLRDEKEYLSQVLRT